MCRQYRSYRRGARGASPPAINGGFRCVSVCDRSVPRWIKGARLGKERYRRGLSTQGRLRVPKWGPLIRVWEERIIPGKLYGGAAYGRFLLRVWAGVARHLSLGETPDATYLCGVSARVPGGGDYGRPDPRGGSRDYHGIATRPRRSPRFRGPRPARAPPSRRRGPSRGPSRWSGRSTRRSPPRGRA